MRFFAPEGTRGDHWVLNTTVRCQHRCVYCFEGDRAGHTDVAFEDAQALLREAARHVPAVTFMGAEPTLNPDLPQLVAAATRLGLHADISTNALRLARWEYLCALRRAGIRQVELSFHYPDAEVYEAITRAKPKGFAQLLAALDNLERLNRDPELGRPPLPVNVNVVVSPMNVARLPEVVEHVRARFDVTPYKLTFKRVHSPLDSPDEAQNPFHVPMRRIRRAVQELQRRYGDSVDILFSDLPLCAFPGWEDNHQELFYWLHDTTLAANFHQQDEMQSLVADARRRERHEADWLCDLCALDPICLSRRIFQHAMATPDDCPVPVRGAVPPRLLATVAQSPRGAAALATAGAAVSATSESALLRSLWDVAPPGARLPGGAATWEPLGTGTLLLDDGGSAHRVRVGAPAPAWRELCVAGRWAVAPAGEPWGDGPPGAVRALAATLAGLPAPAAPPAPDGDAALALLRAVAAGAGPAELVVARPAAEPDARGREVRALRADGSEALRLLVDEAGARPVVSVAAATCPEEDGAARLLARLERLRPFAHAWDRFVVETLAPRAGALASAPAAAGAGRAITVLGGFSDAVLLRRADGQVAACRVSPLDGLPAAGALCGAALVRPTAALLAWPEGPPWIEAVATALLAAQQEGRCPPQPAPPPLVAEAWRIFGRTLWPRAGRGATLARAVIAADGVRLELTAGGAPALVLRLEPRRRGVRYVATRGQLGLSYEVPGGTPPAEGVAAVLAWYARRLAAGGPAEVRP
ncbi:MAG TPA: radical SAM protein [Polyangia bacterium]|jgi:sulfatase maturation enzyme AslB (radical SAM superfamily)